MAAPGPRIVEPTTPVWQWPIHVASYDRSGSLSGAERRVLTHDLAEALAVERHLRAALDRLRGIERLYIPLEEALAAIDSNGHYDQRVKLMVLKQCALLDSAYWAWDTTTWCRILGMTQQAFFAAQVPKPVCGGERQVLMATAYLLRCFNDIPALGEVKRVALAEKIFGVERIAATLRRIQVVTAGWGYRAQCQPLMSLVAELFLIQQCPELESLSLELLESVRTRWQDSNYRSSLYFQLARALAALGIIASEPKIRNRRNPELARQMRIAGIAYDWVITVERWEATSTLAPRSRSHTRDAILKAGRWLQDAHPDITRAEQWTRELAAEYVATVCRMKVGDYVAKTTAIAYFTAGQASHCAIQGLLSRRHATFLCRSAGVGVDSTPLRSVSRVRHTAFDQGTHRTGTPHDRRRSVGQAAVGWSQPLSR